jgi:hypothetical protein
VVYAQILYKRKRSNLQRLKNSLEEFRVPKAQEVQCCIRAPKLKVKEFTKKRESKGRRPLRVGNSSKSGKKVRRKLRRAQQPSDRRRKYIWTIDFHVQEELGRSTQKEETVSHRISPRNPVSRWIGRRCIEFKCMNDAQKNGSRSLDLEQVTLQPSDRAGAA